MPTTPYAETRLAKYITQRILELHHKTQANIAQEAGFRNANYITMLKQGSSKLALDRVPSLAKALDTEPGYLMRLALEQSFGVEVTRSILNVAGLALTKNEYAWLSLIARSSTNTDPLPDSTALAALKSEIEKLV